MISTHLKNIFVELDHFSYFRGNTKKMKPLDEYSWIQKIYMKIADPSPKQWTDVTLCPVPWGVEDAIQMIILRWKGLVKNFQLLMDDSKPHNLGDENHKWGMI